jgi:hypothetical protein
MYFYSAFGIHIQSPIKFPELVPINKKSLIDVRILFEETSQHLTNVLASVPGFQIAPNEVLLFYQNIGRFWIKKGREIVVEAEKGLKTSDLRSYLLGSCMGTILMQRGYQALHGSAVNINGKAALFLGNQGAGKSTLAAYLSYLGNDLLTDDLCTLLFCGEYGPRESTIISRQVHLIPSYPQLKLGENALKMINKTTSKLRKVNPIREKYALSVKKFKMTPVPISHIFLLNYGRKIKIEAMDPCRQIHTLMENTYRRRIFQGLFSKQEHFNRCAVLCSKVPVFKLTRPRDLSALGEVSLSLKMFMQPSNV